MNCGFWTASSVEKFVASELCFVHNGEKTFFDTSAGYLFPGLVDVHVHLREPGFSYKETIASGTRAAARGGYTSVGAMPNLNPVPDSVEHLEEQRNIIARDALVSVHPYGAITVGEAGKLISDMEGMAANVLAFSDDGRGVQSEDMMREAMSRAKKLGKIIAAHCEDNSLLRGGCIHDGEFARANGFAGICSESEYGPIARDIRLAAETGCAYHVCHISTKESVALIRQAKRDGVDITCETAPHYLLMNDGMLMDDGRFKMNPPIRSEADREALIEGILDGTIDMIATDHAPHSAEEKSKGLRGSVMGVVGLETAFAAMYTGFVKTGILSLEALIRLMSENPAKRFGLKTGFEEGCFTVFRCDEEYTIDPQEFLTMGRSTPFEGHRVFGRCALTVCNGRIVYDDGSLKRRVEK